MPLFEFRRFTLAPLVVFFRPFIYDCEFQPCNARQGFRLGHNKGEICVSALGVFFEYFLDLLRFVWFRR